MKVEIEENFEINEYDEYLNSLSNTPFTLSRNHLLLLQDILKSKTIFVTAKENQSLIGTIPFFVKKGTHGIVVNSLPFFGSHGGVVSSNNQIMKKMIQKFNEYNNENDVLSSIIISNPFSNNEEIYQKHFNFVHHEKRFTQCSILNNETKDTLWDKLEKRVRWTVKKCLKNSVSVENTEINQLTSSEFYEMYKIGILAKKGRLKPKNFFELVKHHFTYKEDYDIYVAKLNSKPIAYLLIFFNKPYAEYYMPAFDNNLSNINGTSILIWKSIIDSIDRKFSYYNFGGTLANQKSLYLFKRGWNSKDFFYHYYIQADLERLKSIDTTNILTEYENFYVFPFSSLKDLKNNN